MMKREALKGLLHKLLQPAPILAGAAGLTALLLVFEFNLLEAALYDFRMTSSVQYKPDPRIVVVTLDEETEKDLSEHAPLPLHHHTALLEKLMESQALAVGYLIRMDYVNQIDPERFVGDAGSKFVATVKEMEKRGIGFLMGSSFDINGEVISPFPLSTLPHAFAKIHKDGNVFADDKVARRSHLALYDRPTFHLLLAQKAGLLHDDFNPKGSFRIPEIESSYFFFRYHGAPTFDHEDSYRRISFKDLLKGTVDLETLKGKIILVGTMNKQNPSDLAKTPFHKRSALHPKMAIHANILDTLIHNDGLVLAPRWTNWVLTFLVVVFVLWWVLTSKPLHGVFATFGLALLVLVFGQLLFRGIGKLNGVWIQLSQPLVGIFLSYYLVVPYRLIREYKKRWDYQKQNEVLTEVEELKTNFLSLVTHDLKTPVARIQGLAEVLKKQLGREISPLENEAIEHIMGSTDELNRFISSILELSKIESDRVTLNLESKDINLIIEKCIERFENSAKRRGIRIAADLEPLFPIKVDPSLIGKVVSNLIDNAIKYSPNNAIIEIQSREKDNMVEISVTDHGMGMSAEELKNMFTKFYRVKNERTEAIKGTGLGLYLTRYFVEAHLGKVSAESSLDKGSTFRIYLPQDIDAARKQAMVGSSLAGFRPGLLFIRNGFNRFLNKASKHKEHENV